jgi:Zn-dependent oligopeptidase
MLKKYFNLKELNSFDLAYYSRIYKEKEYKIDSKELKKYFEFENVLTYLHNLVNKLYGVDLKQIDLKTYSEDVRVYEVYKD